MNKTTVHALVGGEFVPLYLKLSPSPPLDVLIDRLQVAVVNFDDETRRLYERNELSATMRPIVVSRVCEIRTTMWRLLDMFEPT
mgnify:FL=1